MTTPSSQSSGRSTKKRFGMGDWSKQYNTKCKDLQKFNDNKKTLLKMLLATLLFLRDIYKQVEKDQDLIKTLLLLRDVCFSGRYGGLTFHPMTCLEQCKQTVRLEQNGAPHECFKEELKNQFESLKAHTGKFPLGTTSLTTIIRDQDDDTGTKPRGVTSWKKITLD